jgi:hypothetical protein
MATVPDSQERQRTSAAIDVAAPGYDGMRRQLEHPEIEQVDRAAALPSRHAVCVAGVST